MTARAGLGVPAAVAGKGPTSGREAQVPRKEDQTSEILPRDEAATAETSDVAGDAPVASAEAAGVVS